MAVGLVGYSLAAISLLFLSFLLLTSWRGRIEGAFLVAATFTSGLWAISALCLSLWQGPLFDAAYETFEVLINLVWFVFLFQLLIRLKQAGGADAGLLHYSPLLIATISLSLIFLMLFDDAISAILSSQELARLQLLGHLGFAITGLVLIEQLFRNTRPENRWAVKYLYLGIGSLFMFNFFLYSDALLFRQVNNTLWDARGFVVAILMPLVAVAAARNPNWSVSVFVSRRVVFHTTVLMGTGLYLLLMSIVGYHIKYYGTWGEAAQISLLFIAGIFLISVLFSSHFRSSLKVFLNKHFFNYKYDYRDEWLRINETLSDQQSDKSIEERVIKAIADLVDSGGGALWMLDQTNEYSCVSSWNTSMTNETVEVNHSLVQFFKDRDWIIDFNELEESPGLYGELVLPPELLKITNAWLLVPIKYHPQLIGFIILTKPRAPREINWEDRDLLKAAAQQVGSYLAFINASKALAMANQFEAFNRLSAFVVHDLKNLVAQLELVVKNADRHKQNPAFVEDAINTVDNATKKMNRLLSQLRKERFHQINMKLFSIYDVLQQVINDHSAYDPKPQLRAGFEDVMIMADKDRFAAIIGHLIKNAQEATDGTGFVKIGLQQKEDSAEITIEDNGAGMDAQFIKDKLFTPFETTKGNAGMGVGVYESREFIRALGGDIKVTSQVGKGTSFTLTLPGNNDSDKMDLACSTQHLRA